MFSKFPSTKALIKNIQLEQGMILFTQYCNLPENKVLFLSHPKVGKYGITILKIYSQDDLKKPLLEKTLDYDYDLSGVLPDGSLLLNKGGYYLREELLKLSCNTLEIVGSQRWQDLHLDCVIGVIDNERFFTIYKNKYDNKAYYLSIYQWDKNGCIEINKTKLNHYPHHNYGIIRNIQSLGHNRYCCEYGTHDNSRIFIFEINPNTHAVQELTVIQPKILHAENSFETFDTYVVLSNNQILAYQAFNFNVQIWDKETFQCVRKWNWADIERPKSFTDFPLKILPLPNCKHFLIHSNKHFYLFNKDSSRIKTVHLDYDIDWNGEHHILSNGQVLAFVEDEEEENEPEKLTIVQFDLPEILHYREVLYQSQKVAAYFLKKNHCPKYMIQHIFSYAFTEQSKAVLAEKILDKHEDREENTFINTLCRLM